MTKRSSETIIEQLTALGQLPGPLDTFLAEEEKADLALVGLIIDNETSRCHAAGVKITLLHYLKGFPRLSPNLSTCRRLILHEISDNAEGGDGDVAKLVEKYPAGFASTIRRLAKVARMVSDSGAAKGDWPEFERGQSVGKYNLRQKIGQGSSGVVWHAHDTQLGRDVALKLLPPGENPKAKLLKLLAEVRAAADIHHPNVIGVHSAGELPDGWLFIDFQLCAATRKNGTVELGHSLRTAIDDGSLVLDADGKRAAKIVRSLCKGVAVAHRLGVVHGDIKPENVLLMPLFEEPEADLHQLADQPMLADFGLAGGEFSDERTELSGPRVTSRREINDRVFIGTPLYMCPEQARGFSKGSDIPRHGRWDVYGLGALLFYLLTKGDPYADKLDPSAPDEFEHIRHLVLDSNESPGELPDRIPFTLRGIVQKAMAKRPEDRFQTVRELEDALDQFLNDRHCEAVGPHSIDHRARLWYRRNTRLANITGSLLAIIAIIVVTYTWHLRTARDQANTAKRSADVARIEAVKAQGVAEQARGTAESESKRFSAALGTLSVIANFSTPEDPRGRAAMLSNCEQIRDLALRGDVLPAAVRANLLHAVGRDFDELQKPGLAVQSLEASRDCQLAAMKEGTPSADAQRFLAFILNHLGWAYLHNGSPDKAYVAQSQSLKICEQHLGEFDADTVVAEADLAAAAAKAPGKSGELEERFLNAMLRAQRTSPGKINRGFLMARMLALAGSIEKTWDDPAKRAEVRKSLQDFLGPFLKLDRIRHRLPWTMAQFAGHLDEKMNLHRAALAIATIAVDMAEADLGTEHPDTKNSRAILERLEATSNRGQVAKP